MEFIIIALFVGIVIGMGWDTHPVDDEHLGSDIGPCMCDACIKRYPSHESLDSAGIAPDSVVITPLTLGEQLSTQARERIHGLVRAGRYDR